MILHSLRQTSLGFIWKLNYSDEETWPDKTYLHTLLGSLSEGTFENWQWRKATQMQVIWLCIMHMDWKDLIFCLNKYISNYGTISNTFLCQLVSESVVLSYPHKAASSKLSWVDESKPWGKVRGLYGWEKHSWATDCTFQAFLDVVYIDVAFPQCVFNV